MTRNSTDYIELGPYVVVAVNSRYTTACLDSGADITIISYDYVNRNDIPFQKGTKAKMRNAYGVITDYVGTCDLSITAIGIDNN